jgi:hypothetical protein
MALVIRAEQMRVFEDEALRRTAADVLDYLQFRVPDCLAGLSQAEAISRARIAVDRALQFGLRLSETSAITIWVRLMFTVAPGFDRHPLCAAILSDRYSPPAMRVESLLLVRNAIPWADVKEFCRGQIWEA